MDSRDNLLNIFAIIGGLSALLHAGWIVWANWAAWPLLLAPNYFMDRIDQLVLPFLTLAFFCWLLRYGSFKKPELPAALLATFIALANLKIGYQGFVTGLAYSNTLLAPPVFYYGGSVLILAAATFVLLYPSAAHISSIKQLGRT